MTGYDTFWTFSCSPLQFMHDFRRYLPHPVFTAAPPGTTHHFWDYVISLHCLFQHFRVAFAIFAIRLDSENSIILSYIIRDIRFSASYAQKLTSNRKKRTARTYARPSLYAYSPQAVKKGAYLAASRMASFMLTALAIPLPAISKAVPWSTDVRRIGIPLVMAMVRSKSRVLVAICP